MSSHPSDRNAKAVSLKSLFPTVDLAVIESVLEAHGGSEDRAVESLLALTDESFVPESRPDLNTVSFFASFSWQPLRWTENERGRVLTSLEMGNRTDRRRLIRSSSRPGGGGTSRRPSSPVRPSSSPVSFSSLRAGVRPYQPALSSPRPKSSRRRRPTVDGVCLRASGRLRAVDSRCRRGAGAARTGLGGTVPEAGRFGQEDV